MELLFGAHPLGLLCLLPDSTLSSLCNGPLSLCCSGCRDSIALSSLILSSVLSVQLWLSLSIELKKLVITLFGFEIFIWFFFPSLSLLSVFSLVSNVSRIAHSSISMTAMLKSLLYISDIFVMLVLASIDCLFFNRFVISLVLGITSDLLHETWVFEILCMRLWILFKPLVLGGFL